MSEAAKYEYAVRHVDGTYTGFVRSVEDGRQQIPRLFGPNHVYVICRREVGEWEHVETPYPEDTTDDN